MDTKGKDDERVRIRIEFDDRDVPFMMNIAAKVHEISGIEANQEKTVKEISTLERQSAARGRRLRKIEKNIARCTATADSNPKLDVRLLETERNKLLAEEKSDGRIRERLQAESEKLSKSLKKAQSELDELQEALGAQYRAHHPEGPQYL